MASGRAGSQILLLMVLLALLGGLGTWNYRRNVAAEEAEYRPYRGYATEQVEQLLAAYREELAAAEAGRQRAARVRVDVRDGGLVGEQVREFERVQRASRSKRAWGSRVAELEVAVEELEEERARRGGGGGDWQVFWTRLTTYRP